jgi:hypothetical protein
MSDSQKAPVLSPLVADEATWEQRDHADCVRAVAGGGDACRYRRGSRRRRSSAAGQRAKEAAAG